MRSLDTEVRRSLRRVVLVVAALNLAYFAVELTVALRIGSVSLYADSVDFLEDTAINVLIALALGMSLRVRSMAGKVMAAIILVPALAAAYEAFTKARSPEPPDVLALVLTAGGWPDIVLGVLIQEALIWHCPTVSVAIRRTRSRPAPGANSVVPWGTA